MNKKQTTIENLGSSNSCSTCSTPGPAPTPSPTPRNRAARRTARLYGLECLQRTRP